MTTGNTASIYQERLRQIEDDRQHDMAVANGKIARKALRLACGAVAWIIAAFALVIGGALDLHTTTHMTNGLIVGGISYLSPSLEMKEKVKKYYELERDEVERSMASGADDSRESRNAENSPSSSNSTES